MSSLRDRSLSRILLLRLDNVGDVVLLTPAMRCLRAAYPEAEITLLASPAGAQLAPLLPFVDCVWTRRALWQDARGTLATDPAAEWAFIEELRRAAFDAAFVFTSFSQSPYAPAYACFLAGIPVRVGQGRDFSGAVLTHWIRPGPDAWHQAERNLHLLRSVGFSPEHSRLTLDVPVPVADSARRKLALAGIDPTRPYLCVAPGASCSARRYPASDYRSAIKRILRSTGLPVALIGAPRERTLLEGIARDLEGVVALAGTLDLPEACAVIQYASLVLTNDSGPMHMADAFGRPQVVLFSGTELESQWRPRLSPALLLRRPTPCTPCYRFDCCHDLECLDIPPEEVEAAVLKLLTFHERRKTRRVA